jgi:ubiquinone/menaquinone biosynthesis C-methylase UbiE
MRLNDPRKALAEMKRVVKLGGYVVVDDPDWETMVVDTSDRAVTRKIRWLTDLEEHGRDERFFSAVTGFTVSGRKL